MKIKKSTFLLLPLAVLVPPIAIVSCSSNSDSNQEISKELYDPAGGNINNLKVDKYLNVVKKLDLNSDTKLTTLSNEGLSQKIQKYDSGASVEILTGSTSQGNLSLKLTKSNNEEIQINIEGFEKQSNVVFTYSNFQIDEPKWVENLLSVQTSDNLATLESVSSETWTKVIKNFNVQIDDATNLTNVENTTYKKLLNQGVKFSFSGKTTSSTSNLKMKINAKIPGMVYENGSWILDQNNEDQIEQLQPDTTNLTIPTLDIVKEYVIEKTTVDESVLPTFYPSKLQAEMEFHKKKKTNFIWDNLVKNELIEDASNNEIMQKYFKGKVLKLVFDLDEHTINDWTNALIFNVNLELDRNVEKEFQKNFRYSKKNKSIEDLGKQYKWETKPTEIDLKADSQILSNTLIGLKNHTLGSEMIDDYFSGKETDLETNIPVDYNSILDDNFNQSLYDIESNQGESDHKKLIDKIKEIFELKFLNKSLDFDYDSNFSNPSDTKLMYKTGLFNFDGNIFQIKKLNLVVDSQAGNKILVGVKPASDKKKIEVSFQGKFIVKFNKWETKTFDVTFKYELDQSKWNSIQATPTP